MSSPTIAFAYSGSANSDPWWARLEQEGIPDDTATLNDAATLIDALYSISSCDDQATSDLSTTDDPSASDFSTIATAVVNRLVCQFDADGSIEVVVRTIRSRQDSPYRLALTGGDLLTTETVRERITKTVIVDASDSITLDYPVIGEFSVSGMSCSRVGNTLRFSGIYSGSIVCSYLTEYDRCTVRIRGIDGQPGECMARVFFHGLVADLQLKIPETADVVGTCTTKWTADDTKYDVTCYNDVTVSIRCQCTDREVDSYTYQEVVSCPEGVDLKCPGNNTACMNLLESKLVKEYVDCEDSNEVQGTPGYVHPLSTEKYYKEHCCKKPNFALPDCPEKTITWRGAVPYKDTAGYKSLWPNLQLVPVSPPGGICGSWTIRQSIASSDCCDGIPALVWDNAVSPAVMAPNGMALVGVSNSGKGYFSWTVSGEGFQFRNGSRRITTETNRTYLVALVGACGTATIEVTDGCSTVIGQVRSTSGSWQLAEGLDGSCLASGLYQDASYDLAQEYVAIRLRRISGLYRQTQWWRSCSMTVGYGMGQEITEEIYRDFCGRLYAEAVRQGLSTPDCLDVPYPRNKYYPIMRNLRDYSATYSYSGQLIVNQSVTFPAVNASGDFLSVEEWKC